MIYRSLFPYPVEWKRCCARFNALENFSMHLMRYYTILILKQIFMICYVKYVRPSCIRVMPACRRTKHRHFTFCEIYEYIKGISNLKPKSENTTETRFLISIGTRDLSCTKYRFPVIFWAHLTRTQCDSGLKPGSRTALQDAAPVQVVGRV